MMEAERTPASSPGPSEEADPRTVRPWALVTGGSRGIGRAVCLELADRGWNVAIAYLRNDDAAEDVAAEARRRGGRVLLQRRNVLSPDEREELLVRVEAEAGRLDGFVHCAALGGPDGALDRRENRWRLAWDSQVGSLLDLVAGARRLFGPSAAVVALSSLGARRIMPGYAPIAAAKGALESLVGYLAAELAPAGVNVNAVCGGPVDTDSLRAFPAFEDLARESARRPPGRLGRPEDLAPVVAFLLSREARWIRGQVIVADGGFGLY
jgi:enoyl-[acyl-carrier protein] reductase III